MRYRHNVHNSDQHVNFKYCNNFSSSKKLQSLQLTVAIWTCEKQYKM